MIRILLVPTLSLQLAGAAVAGVSKGFAAYGRGDYAVAFEAFSAVAEQGSAATQDSLGVMYAFFSPLIDTTIPKTLEQLAQEKQTNVRNKVSNNKMSSYLETNSLSLYRPKTLEERTAAKQFHIHQKRYNLGIEGTILKRIDADTYLIKDKNENILTIRIPHVDTPETTLTDSFSRDNPVETTAANKQKLGHQKAAYAKYKGIPEKDVTPFDLANWAYETNQFVDKQGFKTGSDIYYIPTGETSKLEGDTRTIADIYNNDDVNLSDLLNKRETNAAFDAPWNRSKKFQSMKLQEERRVAKNPTWRSGYNPDGTERLVKQPDGTHTYGNQDYLRTSLEIEEAMSTTWGTAGSFMNLVAGTVATTLAGVSPIAVFVTRILDTPMTVVGAENLADGVTDHNRLTYIANNNGISHTIYNAYISPQNLKTFKRINNSSQGPLSPQDEQFLQTKQGQALQAINSSVKRNRKYVQEITTKVENFRKRYYDSTTDKRILRQFNADATKNGILSATGTQLFNHPLYSAGVLIESFPIMFMILNFAGLYLLYKKFAGLCLLYKKTYAAAMKWYRKTAEQGYAFAQFNLGLMYDNGRGVPQDYAAAVKWYRRAAERGDAQAQNGLGVMYNNGKGVPQDYAAAVMWFRRAAEQGSAAAQGSLGLMYDNGRGVPQDYAAAVKWYRRAAEQGDAQAQNGLGVMYNNGKGGVPQDYIQAHVWYNLAAANGDKDAIKNRDNLAQEMTPSQIEKTQQLAREWRPIVSP